MTYVHQSFIGGLQQDESDDVVAFPQGGGGGVVSGGAAAAASRGSSSGGAGSSANAGAAAAGTTSTESSHWCCAAKAAGVKEGDMLVALNGRNVEAVSLDQLKLVTIKLNGQVGLTLRRDGSLVRVNVETRASLGLFFMVRSDDGNKSGPFYVSRFIKSTWVPQQPAPSKSLIHEIALQLHGINHKQCEATQWLTSNDRAVLRKFLDDYTNNGGFYPSEAAMLAGQMRRSLGRLINAAGFPGWNGLRWLNSAAKTMLEAMLTRAHTVHSEATATQGRKEIPYLEREKNRYDPSTGVAYHFTQSGRRLFYWPKYKCRSEKGCSCRKPDWMRIAPKGRSEGVLTFMCMRSGVVLGNTMLTGHEGCKDAGSALYSFHPMRVGEMGLKSVVCDTPCMHATYMNTRAPKDFDEVQWTGDRFHIKPHTCRAIYDPEEYSTYDHTNTSMIEQWHAVMDTLTTTVKGSTLPHAMFLLQTLEDDHYRSQCKARNYPAENQRWG
jgi:hypothetical protein